MGLALWASVIAASLQAVTTRSRWVRVFSLVVVGLCLVGIVFTLTRAVWIGVAASIVFLGLMPRSRRFVPIGLGAIAVTVVIAIALVPNLGDTLTNRAGDSRSVWDRYNSNAAALRMFEARPLLGFGWDTFGRESQPYYRLSADYPFTPPVNDLHELFLSNLVELGALGALLWLLTLGLGVAGGLSGAKRAPPPRSYFQAAMLAYVVCWAVSANFTPLTYPYPNILVWLFIGLAWPPPEPLGEGRAVVERAPIPQVA
jgi:O-antigen ligase